MFRDYKCNKFKQSMPYGQYQFGGWTSGGGFMPHSYQYNAPLNCPPPCYASCRIEDGVIICGCKCPSPYQHHHPGFNCPSGCHASCTIEDGVIICGCVCPSPYQNQYYKGSYC